MKNMYTAIAVAIVLNSIVTICILAECVANCLGWSIFAMLANPIENLTTILLVLATILLMLVVWGIVLAEGKRKYHDQDLE